MSAWGQVFIVEEIYSFIKILFDICFCNEYLSAKPSVIGLRRFYWDSTSDFMICVAVKFSAFRLDGDFVADFDYDIFIHISPNRLHVWPRDVQTGRDWRFFANTRVAVTASWTETLFIRWMGHFSPHMLKSFKVNGNSELPSRFFVKGNKFGDWWITKGKNRPIVVCSHVIAERNSVIFGGTWALTTLLIMGL